MQVPVESEHVTRGQSPNQEMPVISCSTQLAEHTQVGHTSDGRNDGLGQIQLLTGDDGRSFLLDIEHDRILTLNAVAAEMWNLLRTGEDHSEIAAKISEKYEVSKERVEGDLASLVRRLSDLQLSPSRSVSVEQTVPIEPSAPIEQSAIERSAAPSDPRDSPVKQTSFPWYWDAGSDRPQPSLISVVAAFFGLTFFDVILWCSSMRTLCSWVNRWPTRKGSKSPDVRGKICSAVEEACLWYPKRSMCLQRSAVTTCILRSYGVAARMVIGIRPMPFMAHAWVEVDGAVLNDRAGVKKFYQPMVSY